jgi:hypothetical protein
MSPSPIPPIGGVQQVQDLQQRLADARVASGGAGSDAELIASAIEVAGLEIALAVARLGVAVAVPKN